MSRSLILRDGRRIRCPKCGKMTSVLINGVCPECYREESPLVSLPSSMEIRVCRICGAVEAPNGKWVRKSLEDVIREYVENNMHVSGILDTLEVEYDGGDYARVTVYGRIHPDVPQRFREEHVVKIKKHYIVCPSCVKVISKKEEARIQIRAYNRELTQAERRRIREIAEKSLYRSWRRGRAAQPIKVDEGSQGIDIVLASRETARELVSALSSRMFFDILETSKDLGVDESGRGKRRVTYRLLLPPFREGSIVEYKNKPYLVERIRRDRLTVRSLLDLAETRLGITKRMYTDFKVLGEIGSLEEGMIVSVDPPYVLVMSLRDFNSFEVRLSGGFNMIMPGGRVRIFRHGGRVYIIPV